MRFTSLRAAARTAIAYAIIAVSAVGLVACSGMTSQQVATTVATDAAQIPPAASAINGIVADLKDIAASGTVTSAQVATLQSAVGSLEDVAKKITPASSSADLTNAFGTVQSVLSMVGAILPDVLPLLTLIHNDVPARDLMHQVADTQLSTAALAAKSAAIAAMKAHLAELRAQIAKRAAVEVAH